jgi:SPP1 family phage portal protein
MKINELFIKSGVSVKDDGTFDPMTAILHLSQHRGCPLPKIEDYKKQYIVSQHDTVDKAQRPDKLVELEDGKTRLEKVNRLAFPLQKEIVKKAVQFAFGNPVKLNCNPQNEQEKQVFNAVDRILYDNKINGFNRRVARTLFRCSEVAEYWYSVPADEHDDYGFPCKYRVRVALLNPWNNEKLLPYFDENQNMIAFTRDFIFHESDTNKYRCFEIHTDEETLVLRLKENNWQSMGIKPISIKKVPVIFGNQEDVEWADEQYCIDRLEYLLSNFADTNDYHASPKIFVQGRIVGFSRKGEAGGILEGEKDSTAQYLSWAHAPEAVKLEIETLLRFIYGFSQTPDVSFDSVKGLQAISGEALQMLFMDAHLKVQDKREVFDDYLQRRINLVKTFVGKINLQLEKVASVLRITPEIVPYMIDDQTTRIKNLVAANGNKPIISQKSAVAKAGLVENADDEWAQIQAEAKAENTKDIFGTAE